MKILHTSDVHLKQVGDERWNALKSVVNLGQFEQIDAMIISGDLFNKNLDAENIRDEIRPIFSDNGFDILIIPGNHDKEAFEQGYFYGADVKIINDLDQPIEYDDTVVWGLPFEPLSGTAILNKLRAIKENLNPHKTNILLFHGELLDAFFAKDAFGKEGSERYMPVKRSYFADLGFDYVLAGHFHSNFDIWNLDPSGYFVYCGSPVSITKKETGKRYVNLFETGYPPNKHEIVSFYYERLHVLLDPFETCLPREKLQEELQKIDPNARVLLEIGGYVNCQALSTDESTLISELRSLAEHSCEEINPSLKDVSRVWEDDLFKKYQEKLSQLDLDEDQKAIMTEDVIKAFFELMG